MASARVIALDVGEKRIGLAEADTSLRIAVPVATLDVDGTEVTTIAQKVIEDHIEHIIIGYPRNQAGQPTAQTAYVEEFASQLEFVEAEIIFQDESLTSVLAEERLQRAGGRYSKADIDAMAACIILEDYLEAHHE